MRGLMNMFYRNSLGSKEGKLLSGDPVYLSADLEDECRVASVATDKEGNILSNSFQ